MVKMWAEKEFRNLNRLQAAGIASPKPVLLRQHVLVMTFIGDSGGIAAPRLKVLALLSTMPAPCPSRIVRGNLALGRETGFVYCFVGIRL
jgi:RIO kinase 1